MAFHYVANDGNTFSELSNFLQLESQNKYGLVVVVDARIQQLWDKFVIVTI